MLLMLRIKLALAPKPNPRPQRSQASGKSASETWLQASNVCPIKAEIIKTKGVPAPSQLPLCPAFAGLGPGWVLLAACWSQARFCLGLCTGGD